MCVAVHCVQTSANGHNEDLITLISFICSQPFY